MANLRENQEIAREFSQLYVNDLLYLKDIQAFALYNIGYFQLLSHEELEEQIFNFMCREVRKNFTTSTITDIRNMLKWVVKKKSESVMTDYVAFTDKTLNLETFEEVEHSRDHKTVYHVNCSLAEVQHSKGIAPRYLRFIDEVLVKDDLTPDKELQQVFHEMLGYYFLNTTEKQLMFFLIGHGGNGKSVVLELIKNIIGKQFCAGSSIERLTTKDFAASALIGKKINMVGDDESKFIKSDMFKRMIGGEDIEFEKKYEHSFTGTVRTKFLFSTNNPPTFSSIDEGLSRRIKIIPFKRKIPEDQRDTKLLPKLLDELPGIIWHIIEGAKRLSSNNFVFSQSAALSTAHEQFVENISSSIAFLKEQYDEVEGKAISNSDIYEYYRIWCSENGRRPMNSHNFWKDANMVLKLPATRSYDQDKRQTVRARQLCKKTDISN